MTDYVLSGLTKCRAELAGEAAALRTRLAAIATDTGHLDAVIRQFDPDHDIAAIRPRRPRGPDVAGRGEMSRFVLGTLREAQEPVTTAEVVRLLIAARSQDEEDRRLVGRFTKRVAATLRYQGQRGTVRAEPGPGRAVLWMIAS